MSFADGLTLLDASAGPLASAGAGQDGWIKLAPRGRFTTRDGREMEVSPETLLARFNADGVDIPIDIDHAVAKKTIFGDIAPAVGWITRMEARADGLYGFATWLDQGRATLTSKTHRYISPTLKLDASNVAIWLHSVSLVAAPALSMPTVAAAEPVSQPQLETLGTSTMFINDATLTTLFKGFKTLYTMEFDGTKSFKDTVAMEVTSATAEEQYGWLGMFPDLREWIGARHIHGLQTHGFTIRNRKFESTVMVPRDIIEDDKVSIFKPMFLEMGRVAKQHPDTLIFELLKDGFTATCYDGQNFFDDEHPLAGADGMPAGSASNMQGGDGPAWYLLDLSRAIKPIIWQVRQPYDFQSLTSPNDTHVFMTDEFIYGIRARANCGFGLWQLAYASKVALTPTNFKNARKAMMELRGENDLLLGIQPTHLLIPPSLEAEARTLLNSDVIDGSTNIWKGTAELIMTPLVA